MECAEQNRKALLAPRAPDLRFAEYTPRRALRIPRPTTIFAMQAALTGRSIRCQKCLSVLCRAPFVFLMPCTEFVASNRVCCHKQAFALCFLYICKKSQQSHCNVCEIMVSYWCCVERTFLKDLLREGALRRGRADQPGH